MYVYTNELRTDKGEVLGTFSSHWAATAAMLRFTLPEFVSTGGDKAEDLEEERRIRRVFAEANIDAWNKSERERWKRENAE